MDDAAANVSPECRVVAKVAKECSKDLNDKFTRGPVAKVLGFDSRGGAKGESVETLARRKRPGNPPFLKVSFSASVSD